MKNAKQIAFTLLQRLADNAKSEDEVRLIITKLKRWATERKKPNDKKKDDKFRFEDYKVPYAKPSTPYGFNPRRLIVQGKQELSLFPFNVLFMSYGEKDGKPVTGTAVYYPDLPSIGTALGYPDLSSIGVTENTNIIFASYYNEYCLKTDDKGQRHCRLDVYYHKKIKSFRYSAIKYVNNTQVCHANGSNWKEFFANLTAYGLFNDECCRFEE